MENYFDKEMKSQEIRHTRIVELRNMTYLDLKKGMNREQIVTHLKARCVQVGVSKPTAISYIEEVFTSMIKNEEKNNVQVY